MIRAHKVLSSCHVLLLSGIATLIILIIPLLLCFICAFSCHRPLCFFLIKHSKVVVGSFTWPAVVEHAVHTKVRQAPTCLHRCWPGELKPSLSLLPPEVGLWLLDLQSSMLASNPVGYKPPQTRRICVMIFTVWVIHCVCGCVFCFCSLCDLQFSQLVLWIPWRRGFHHVRDPWEAYQVRFSENTSLRYSRTPDEWPPWAKTTFF